MTTVKSIVEGIQQEKAEIAYQVGDMVLIRKDLEVDKRYKMHNSDERNTFVDDMQNVRISSVIQLLIGGYSLVDVGYIWTDEMFEGKIVPVTFDGVFDKSAKGNVKYGDEIVVTPYNKDIEDEFLGKVVTYLEIDKLTGYVKVDIGGNYAYFLKTHILGKLVRPTIEAQEAPKAQEAMVEAPEAPEAPHKDKMEVLEMNDTLIPFNIKLERVIFNNPATIIFYKSGKVTPEGYFVDSDKLLKVVAKVSDGDVFDKSRGLDICLLKAFNRESAKMLKAVINPPKKEVK